jgi:hypothetical protein
MSCDPMTIAHLQIRKANCSRATAAARVRHKTALKLQCQKVRFSSGTASAANSTLADV